MFKRLSSTISTRKSTKTVVNEAPLKAKKEASQPAVEDKEPVSESRGKDAPRDGEARDLQRELVEYTLEGPEGDAIDQVFGTVEKMICAPETDLVVAPPPVTCQITKFSQGEKIGLSLRTSITTDGLYVSKIASGSKFEATALELGQKVLMINGVDCPTPLNEAIGMLKGAKSAVVLKVGPNDEADKKIDEMGEMSNDLVVKKDQLTEIAVDGYADSCGFFWSLQNGLYAFSDTGAKAIEAKGEEQVEEAPKEGPDGDAIDQVFGTVENIICAPEETDLIHTFGDTGVKAIEAKAEEQVEEVPKEVQVEDPKEQDRVAKPEEEKVEENSKSKKKMSFKKPTLPSVKAPSMPSFKFSKKSKKVEEKKPPATETIRGEDGMVTVKLTKDSKDESIGLALRNSVSNDNVYVYGIFEGSKLKKSGLDVNMRVHSINGTVYTNVEEAVKHIKELSSLEFVAGPNDEPETATDVVSEEEQEEQPEEKEPAKEEASASWFW